jgi:hypothetical protein
MSKLKYLAQAALFSLAIHVWHAASFDRVLDCFSEVGIDKVLTTAVHHVGVE